MAETPHPSFPPNAGAVSPPIMGATASSLPVPTMLGEFELTGLLGEGGFSVVYLAVDHSLDRTVAIKEYMPSAIAARQSDGTLLPRSPKHEETFKAGLASFINEARLLARFNHPALIHIHRVWEQNGTAYMAMQYCPGRTLRQVAQTDTAIVRNEAWLKTTFTPVLDALQLLHAQDCFHRDISPDNILVLQNGAPVLLDFGAARQVIGDMTQALTVILKPGFAPIEQYADDASLQQGPWTDVYGVGAVIYFLLRGKPPVASVARLVKDPMLRLQDDETLAAISQSFRAAVDDALAVHPDHRTRSIAELRSALELPTYSSDSQFGGLFPIPPTLAPRTMSGDELLLHRENSDQEVFTRPPTRPRANQSASPLVKRAEAQREKKRWPWVAAAGTVALFASIAAFTALFSPKAPKPDAATTEVAVGSDLTQPPTASTPHVPAAEPIATRVAGASAPSSAPRLPTSQSEATSQEKLPKDSAPAVKGQSVKEAIAPPSMPSAPPIASPASLASPTPPPVPRVPVPEIAPEQRPRSTAQVATVVPTLPASAPTPTRSGVKGTLTNERPPVESREALTLPGSISPPSTNVPARQASAAEPATGGPLEKASGVRGADRSSAVVRLSIRPWGQVSVNGQSRGISPPLTKLQLPAGSHTIVISNGEFASVTKQVQVPERGEVVVSHRFGTE